MENRPEENHEKEEISSKTTIQEDPYQTMLLSTYYKDKIQKFLTIQRQNHQEKNNVNIDEKKKNKKSKKEKRSHTSNIKGKTREEDIIKNWIHNTKGINRTLDQDNILQELKENKVNIMGLSETKLTDERARYSFKD